MDFSYLTTAERTDVGKKRGNNEDMVLSLDHKGVYCVADGMGGTEKGEVASMAIVDALREAFSGRHSSGDETFAETQVLMREAALNANAWILDYARSHGTVGTGSTLIMACFDSVSRNHAMAMHAGDSRLYRFRAGAMVQLSRDHSLAAEAGVENEEDLGPMFQSMVTRAIGVQTDVKLEETPIQVAEDDVFLFCSDGLTRMLSDDRIADIIENNRDSSADETATALVDAANEEGGLDNITVILVRVGTSSAQEDTATLPAEVSKEEESTPEAEEPPTHDPEHETHDEIEPDDRHTEDPDSLHSDDTSEPVPDSHESVSEPEKKEAPPQEPPTEEPVSAPEVHTPMDSPSTPSDQFATPPADVSTDTNESEPTASKPLPVKIIIGIIAFIAVIGIVIVLSGRFTDSKEQKALGPKPPKEEVRAAPTVAIADKTFTPDIIPEQPELEEPEEIEEPAPPSDLPEEIAESVPEKETPAEIPSDEPVEVPDEPELTDVESLLNPDFEEPEDVPNPEAIAREEERRTLESMRATLPTKIQATLLTGEWGHLKEHVNKWSPQISDYVNDSGHEKMYNQWLYLWQKFSDGTSKADEFLGSLAGTVREACSRGELAEPPDLPPAPDSPSATEAADYVCRAAYALQSHLTKEVGALVNARRAEHAVLGKNPSLLLESLYEFTGTANQLTIEADTLAESVETDINHLGLWLSKCDENPIPANSIKMVPTVIMPRLIGKSAQLRAALSGELIQVPARLAAWTETADSEGLESSLANIERAAAESLSMGQAHNSTFWEKEQNRENIAVLLREIKAVVDAANSNIVEID